MHGENENRRDSENGLSPENQQWLDALFQEQETFDITNLTEKQKRPVQPEAPAYTGHEPDSISPEDEELEKILAEDWDNITLPEEEDIADLEESLPQTDPELAEQADAPAPQQEKPYRRFRKRPPSP